MQKRMIAVALTSLLLAACKVDVETTVSTDQLLSAEPQTVTADLNFEVAACQDHRDPSLESRSLIKVKEKVPQIFGEAEYVECHREKMNSFAHFRLPVSVGVLNPDKPFEHDLYVFSAGTIIAGAGVKDEVLPRIKAAEKEAIGALKFNMTFNITKGKNPTPAMAAFGVFMSEKPGKERPLAVATLAWNNASSFTLRLSDVSVQTVMNNGATAFLVKPDFFDALKGKQ